MTTHSHETDPPSRIHKEYYTALYHAALTISSSLVLDQVLQSVVTSITEAMQVKACGLRLLDRATGHMRLSAVYGLSESYLAKGPVDMISSAIDSEAVKGATVYIADARSDARFQYQDAARREGLVSILCVPLEVRGEAIGVMRVYTDKPTTFNKDDVQFLSVLASLSALAIENARLYESVKNSYHGVVDAFWGTSINLDLS
ncbi:MAG: GAF domain-containing protein [Chloroflexota bacterium]|nr:GAF domain-containing protein [Chloroflexota bacterium]